MPLDLIFSGGLSDSATIFRLSTKLSKGRLKRATIVNATTSNCIMFIRLMRTSEPNIASPSAYIDLINRGRAVAPEHLSWEGDIPVDSTWRLVFIWSAPLATNDVCNFAVLVET